MLARLVMIVTFVGCTSHADDAAPRGIAGGKADEAATELCGIAFNGLEYRGTGEVGDSDLPPRSTANSRAAAFNTHSGYDCNADIDQCVAPRYYVDADDKVLVELENTELVIEKQVYIDGELRAVKRMFAGCVDCQVGDCTPQL